MATEAAPSSFFVSYAREDQAFVKRLHAALLEREREVWVDWEAVPALADWRPEVTAAIEGSDVFVFVISDDSATSEVCLMEVEVAAAARKRFAPLVRDDVEADRLPKPVRDPNWLFFREDSDDFDTSLDLLVTAADADYAWVHLHTRLQRRAREWDDANRDESLLTRGRDLEAALHWLAESALRTERDVSPLQVAFLEAAREREAAEAQRAKELYARTLARQLAAQSELVRDASVESVRTSVLLAAESVERWPNVEGDRALRRGLALLSRRPLRRIAHPDANWVALSRDGRTLAVAHQGAVEIWDVATGEAVARKRTDAYTTALEISPDGRWVLAVGNDNTARVWPTDGGRGRRFQMPAPPKATTITRDHLAVAFDQTIHLYGLRAHTKQELLVEGEVTELAIGAGGGALLATVNQGWKGALHVWTLPEGEPLDPIAFDGMVTAAAFTTHGDTLAALAVPTGPWMGPLRGYQDVKLLDLVWEHGQLTTIDLRHDTPVHQVAIGPDDAHVTTVAEPNTVHVWSVNGGRPRGRVTSATRIVARGVDAAGERLATAHEDGTVRVTSVATASPVLAVEAKASRVALDPESNLVVAALQETVVWSTETGAEVARLEPGFPLNTLAFGARGRLLVASPPIVLEPDGTVTSIPHDGHVLGAAFAGERIVTVGTDDVRVDGEAGLTRDDVFALSPDGHRFADAAGHDVRVRALASGETTHTLHAGATVTALQFSADGSRLAVVADAKARVWDLNTAEPGPERELLYDPYIAAVDPAGRYLAVSQVGGRAWLLDLERDRTLEGADTQQAAIDPHGRYAALMEDLGDVEILALPSGEPLVTLPHDAYDTAFSPDGAHAATAGADGALRVWELPGGAEVARMDHPGKLFSPVFGQDGRLLAASCGDGSVWVWTWRPEDLAAEARARAGRGLTPEERSIYLRDAS